MCGICGILSFRDQKDQSEEQKRTTDLKTMTELLRHRGPDMCGEATGAGMALGFRRLTILDLSEKGNQPLYSNDKRFVQVFNGEIYNYKSLRRELEVLGAVFRSDCDSEVLVHAYRYWGTSMVDRLRGMFAFAIWDREEETLFLARDPFGIKPLYYSFRTDDESFLFASEIKSILAASSFRQELNENALLPYLSFQYSAPEECFFKGVYKLLAGHTLFLSRRKGARQTPVLRRFFKPSFDVRKRSLEENIARIRDVVRESVQLHLQSDVPLGCFLSGGIDSSYITSLVRPEHSFSVGFKNYHSGGFNESDYAKRLSEILGVKHHVRELVAEDCFGILPVLQYHMDEPHGNFSAVPLYYLAQLAREYVTVVLSGEGADELFGGYDPYRNSRFTNLYKNLPFPLRRGMAKLSPLLPSPHLRRALHRAGQKPEEYFLGEMNIFSPADARRLLKADFRGGESAFDLTATSYAEIGQESELNQKQLIDMEYWLPSDILLKADKMSSAHSLELRVPFLDKEVWNVARELPENQRVFGLRTKHALREAARSEIPDEWSSRNKLGFMVPFRDWFREDKWFREVASRFRDPLCEQFFDSKILLEMLEAHRSGQRQFQHEIYLPYTFLIWYDVFFRQKAYKHGGPQAM